MALASIRSAGWLLLGMAAVALLTSQSADVASRDAEPGRPDTAGAQGARYWKGNLHTHSLWSDGDQFPEMVAAWYKENGYHFLAVTEHNMLQRGGGVGDWLQSDGRPLGPNRGVSHTRAHGRGIGSGRLLRLPPSPAASPCWAWAAG